MAPFDANCKALAALSVQESSGSSPPPSYEESEKQQTPTPRASSKIPKLWLLGGAGPSTSSSVTEDQCIAHLKFLAVLADLRDTMSSEDGLFGINDSEAGRFAPGDAQNRARAKLREKRWEVYTSRAVKRFFAWWQNCVPTYTPSKLPSTDTLETSTLYEGDMCGKYRYRCSWSYNYKSPWKRGKMPPIGRVSPNCETLEC